MLENNNVSQMPPYYSCYIQRGAPLVFYCEVTIGREGSMFMIFVDRPNSILQPHDPVTKKFVIVKQATKEVTPMRVKDKHKH